jgi:hypothetical protein
MSVPAVAYDRLVSLLVYDYRSSSTNRCETLLVRPALGAADPVT